MAAADVHPSVEELTAFTLGTLDEEAQASVEAHVAACTSCQERAAVAPPDHLVEVVRRVRARTGCGGDTFAEAAAQVQTPVLFAAVAGTEALAPAVAPAAPAESGSPEVPAAIPPELAGHARYRVLRPLGAGGMGVVYQAEHRVMQRLVAVKVINRAYTGNAVALDRFRGEVRNAARLCHPNIVVTHDAEDAGETQFLVMEYVDGTDLGRLIREGGPRPVDRACDYVRQAALGLQYAFEQGMVHRDLKPHNLMLTPDGRVKILDFGLARFASESASAAGVTGTGMVLGTVDYIAPEQADSARQADIRSDIYSLGCTLYHLLAGQPPFPTGTPIQKMMAHVQKKPQPLTELRPDLPEGFMPVLERMMAKNPKRRYQTPAEVAVALEPFTFAPAARDDGRTDVLDNTSVRRRRRRQLLIATAILAFLVAGLLGVAVYRIATDKGELVIETDNDDVEVVVSKGGQVVKIIDTKSGKHVTLNSGEYDLSLKDGQEGLTLLPDRMTLKRGERKLATITREGKRGNPSAGPPPGETVGEIRRFEGHTNGAFGVAFSPDGRHALSGAGDGTVRLWEVATGREVRRFSGHNAKVEGVAFSPDGRQALTASFDQTVRLWDVQTGKAIHVLKGHTGIVLGVAFSPDGRRALSGGMDETMRLWDLESGKELRAFAGAWGGVAFSPDGRQALSGGHSDPLVRLWDLETGAGLRELRGHTGTVTCVVFLPGGRQALSCSHDRTLRLWDLDSGEEIRRFSGHTHHVQRVAITRDGRYALSASGDRTVRFWDLHTGKELHCFTGHTGGVLGVAISPDGKFGLSGGNEDNTVRLWRLPDPPPAKENLGEVRRFEGHTGWVCGVAFSPDGRHALSSAGDGIVRLWEVATGREVRRFSGHDGYAEGVAFSPDGRQALTTGHDRTVRLWNVQTGKEIRVLRGHTNIIHLVAFSPDGRRALSGGDDDTVRLWDLESGRELRRFPGFCGVAFSPDGRLALSGESSGQIGLWDIETGAHVRQLLGHRRKVASVVFLPGGRQALSGSHDGTLRLWDLDSGQEIRCFSGHTDIVCGVAITRDGRYAVSGGDKTVRVWDLQTGKELHCFTGHTERVGPVAVSPDDRYALSGGCDGTMRLWRLPDLPPAKEKP
jgi:WD40 repeat protein